MAAAQVLAAVDSPGRVDRRPGRLAAPSGPPPRGEWTPRAATRPGEWTPCSVESPLETLPLALAARSTRSPHSTLPLWRGALSRGRLAAASGPPPRASRPLATTVRAATSSAGPSYLRQIPKNIREFFLERHIGKSKVYLSLSRHVDRRHARFFYFFFSRLTSTIYDTVTETDISAHTAAVQRERRPTRDRDSADSV